MLVPACAFVFSCVFAAPFAFAFAFMFTLVCTFVFAFANASFQSASGRNITELVGVSGYTCPVGLVHYRMPPGFCTTDQAVACLSVWCLRHRCARLSSRVCPPSAKSIV